MPKIEIRPAIATDIQALTKLEHNYSSDFVWQMDFRQEDGEVNITFREVRLPRSAQVRYPREHQNLVDTWTQRDGLLVAEMENEIVGYVSLIQNKTLRTTSVTDLAVMRRIRRQGIGSALVIASQEWANQSKSRRLIFRDAAQELSSNSISKEVGL